MVHSKSRTCKRGIVDKEFIWDGIPGNRDEKL